MAAPPSGLSEHSLQRFHPQKPRRKGCESVRKLPLTSGVSVEQSWLQDSATPAVTAAGDASREGWQQSSRAQSTRLLARSDFSQAQGCRPSRPGLLLSEVSLLRLMNRPGTELGRPGLRRLCQPQLRWEEVPGSDAMSLLHKVTPALVRALPAGAADESQGLPEQTCSTNAESRTPCGPRHTFGCKPAFLLPSVARSLQSGSNCCPACLAAFALARWKQLPQRPGKRLLWEHLTCASYSVHLTRTPCRSNMEASPVFSRELPRWTQERNEDEVLEVRKTRGRENCCAT